MRKSIYKKTNGVGYVIKTRKKIDGEYVNITISTNSKGEPYLLKKEANDDYNRAVNEWIRNHAKTQSGKITTVDRLVNEWLRKRELQGYHSGTIDADMYLLEKYLTKKYGDYKICDFFNKNQVTSWFNDLMKIEEISNRRKTVIVSKFKKILEFAYQNLYIDATTFQICDTSVYTLKGVEHKQNKDEKRNPWTQDELQQFLDVIPVDSPNYVMYKLFFFLGCRLGEFLGLTADKLDCVKHTIEISQQSLKLGKIVQILKTDKSYRKIKLTSEMFDCVYDYINKYNLKDNDLLFYVSRHKFRYTLYDYMKKADVRIIVPHCSRNTEATHLLSQCNNIEEVKAVADRLGHSTTTCMNIYLKTHEETETDILDRVYTKKKSIDKTLKS